MISHIFFDLDRTLWDFETNTSVALEELYLAFELNKKSNKNVADFIASYRKHNDFYWDLYLQKKVSREEVRLKRFELTLNDLGINDEGIAPKLSEAYVNNAPYQKRLFPGVHETLVWLSEKGYKLTVITNGFLAAQEIKLQQSGIRSFFDYLISSEAVGEGKPHPKIFKHVLNLYAVSPDKCLMLGDSFNVDVIGAEHVGIRGVLFDPHNMVARRPGIEKIEQFSDLKNVLLGIH